MKKRVVFVLLIIAAMLSSNFAYADNQNSLDVVKATTKVLDNSWSFKAVQKSFEAASDFLAQSEKVPYYNAYQRSRIQYQYDYSFRQMDVLQNSIFLQAYAKYVEVAKAKYAVDVQKMVLELANESYNNNVLKYKLQQVSKDQLAISEGQYNAERLLLQIKERELQTKVVSLNMLMGESSTNQYSDIIDNNMIPAAEIGSSEDYVNSAITNRAEILNAKDQLGIKTKQKQLEFIPQGVHNDANYQQVKNEIDLLESQVEMSTVDVESEVLSLYDNLKNSMAALDDAIFNMNEAEKDLKSAELKYKLGVISKFDIKSEQLNYTKIKYELKQAQLDAWLMQNQMNFAIGTGIYKQSEEN